MNLPIYLFKEIMYLQCGSNVGGAGVALSDFRKEIGIPNSTFYRSVKTLIDANIIIRVRRDRYSVSPTMLHHCAQIEKEVRHG